MLFGSTPSPMAAELSRSVDFFVNLEMKWVFCAKTVLVVNFGFVDL